MSLEIYLEKWRERERKLIQEKNTNNNNNKRKTKKTKQLEGKSVFGGDSSSL